VPQFWGFKLRHNADDTWTAWGWKNNTSQSDLAENRHADLQETAASFTDLALLLYQQHDTNLLSFKVLRTKRRTATHAETQAGVRLLHVTPLDRAGQALPPMEIEITNFWYVNRRPLEPVGPCYFTNGQRAVQFRTGDQECFLTGRDYWQLLHGQHRVSMEEAGILEARLHQVIQPPRSLLATQPESLWCQKEPLLHPERSKR
jgi:hypothetical protein